MKTRNHYKIGRILQAEMTDNNMPLNKFLFIIGNMAPDLTLSYLFRQHSYSLCAPWFNKLIGKLYRRRASSSYMRFSFLLGVASHFICDFFCYPHTSEYSGSTLDHVRYESKQDVNTEDLPPFDISINAHIGYTALIYGLDKNIAGYEMSLSGLSGDTEIPVIDVQHAARVTLWVASSIYHYAALKHVFTDTSGDLDVEFSDNAA